MDYACRGCSGSRSPGFGPKLVLLVMRNPKDGMAMRYTCRGCSGSCSPGAAACAGAARQATVTSAMAAKAAICLISTLPSSGTAEWLERAGVCAWAATAGRNRWVLRNAGLAGMQAAPETGMAAVLFMTVPRNWFQITGWEILATSQAEGFRARVLDQGLAQTLPRPGKAFSYRLVLVVVALSTAGTEHSGL